MIFGQRDSRLHLAFGGSAVAVAPVHDFSVAAANGRRMPLGQYGGVGGAAHALGHDDVFREREPLRRRVRLLMDEGRETRSLAHSFPSRTQGSRREGE